MIFRAQTEDQYCILSPLVRTGQGIVIIIHASTPGPCYLHNAADEVLYAASSFHKLAHIHILEPLTICVFHSGHGIFRGLLRFIRDALD